MTDNTPVLLLAAGLIGLISLVIGAVIGLILPGLRNPPAVGGASRSKDQVEIARMVRNLRSGELGVEINGKIFATSTDLTPAQRENLIQIHDELQLWLGVDDLPGRTASAPAQSPQAPTPRLAPAGGERPASPPVSSRSVSTLAPSTPLPAQKPPRPEPASNVRPPSLEIGDILSRAMNPTDPAREAQDAPTTLAGQVDAIIQERLLLSPLKDRSIKLKDSPDGGIVVLVDGQRYHGVGEVAETQVREFIQACVAEWEKKYGK